MPKQEDTRTTINWDTFSCCFISIRTFPARFFVDTDKALLAKTAFLAKQNALQATIVMRCRKSYPRINKTKSFKTNFRIDECVKVCVKHTLSHGAEPRHLHFLSFATWLAACLGTPTRDHPCNKGQWDCPVQKCLGRGCLTGAGPTDFRVKEI